MNAAADNPVVATMPQDSLDALAAALREHPCLAEVHVAEVPAETAGVPGGGAAVVAWVVPERASLRVPARGPCLLVEDDGREHPGQLVDVSFDGLRVRVDSVPPPVGAAVQANVEPAALAGGVEGWLGVVCWQAGRDVGISFAGNWDERAALVRLIHECAEQHEQAAAEPEPFPAGPAPRIALDVACTLTDPAGVGHATRTLDISATGIGLVAPAGLHGALHGAAVRLRLGVPGGSDRALPGVVVREDGGVLGVALAPDAAARDWLGGLVARAIRSRVVSARSLTGWLAQAGVALPDSLRVVVTDALPRDGGALRVADLPPPLA
ncbi:MAG: PilZ domain-containing protein [Planctomycetes bacterium]|nr:PilZ domain-containing protein [Planctomycetota bacterium]